MKSRKLVIGDIHGGLKALEQVLFRVNLLPNDRLIFLGDYVDGWSQSKEVIDYLIELDKTYTCIFIKGNHDGWCENWLFDGGKNDVWLFHGGESTVRSYAFSSPAERNEHLAFFQRMRNYWVDEENNLFIHAGFTSMHGPEKEVYSSNYNWDRTLWEMAVSLDKNIAPTSSAYPKRLTHYNELFIGHTPTLEYGSDKPMQAATVWNVDTGAAFSGKLTVLDANTKHYWQSDTVQSLYPNEKGRNRD